MVFAITTDIGWIRVPTWLHFGAVWAPKTRLGSVLEHLGGVLERLRGMLGRLGCVLGAFRDVLGSSWVRLGASEVKNVAAIILEASKIEKSLKNNGKQ